MAEGLQRCKLEMFKLLARENDFSLVSIRVSFAVTSAEPEDELVLRESLRLGQDLNHHRGMVFDVVLLE